MTFDLKGNQIYQNFKLTLIHMAMASDKPSLHSFCSHFQENKATTIKIQWQFEFKTFWYFHKVIFSICNEIISKIWIFQHLIWNFPPFLTIFMKLWSRGKHSWLWIGSAGFKSRWDQTIFNCISLFFVFTTVQILSNSTIAFKNALKKGNFIN